MTSLLLQGLDKIATAAMRDQAAEVLYLDACGYSTLQIANRVGVKLQEVVVIRDTAGDCVIEAMRDSGYADVEIIRTLGVATARVALAAA